MDAERLASTTLKAYGFALTAAASATMNPQLIHVLRAIGKEPLAFARSNTLGIGWTVAHDELGRLWAICGQFDMRPYGLKDYTPERPYAKRRP